MKLLRTNMPSLSIFFPCYNDRQTIAVLIAAAGKVAEKLTDDYEVIVIDDGSTDGSRDLLLRLKEQIPRLKVLLHERNLGYGSVVRAGFKAATKDLIFYTDGDGQYDINELPRLLEKMTDSIDIVNGYKIKRNDPALRIIIGFIYKHFVRYVFQLKIRDVDCDFRLIRKRVVESIVLTSTTGTICVELIKKIELADYTFCEVAVSHRHRTYNSSQFFTPRRIVKTLYCLLLLWRDIFILKKNVKR